MALTTHEADQHNRATTPTPATAVRAAARRGPGARIAGAVVALALAAGVVVFAAARGGDAPGASPVLDPRTENVPSGSPFDAPLVGTQQVPSGSAFDAPRG